jgi:hypothetical protein
MRPECVRAEGEPRSLRGDPLLRRGAVVEPGAPVPVSARAYGTLSDSESGNWLSAHLDARLGRLGAALPHLPTVRIRRWFPLAGWVATRVGSLPGGAARTAYRSRAPFGRAGHRVQRSAPHREGQRARPPCQRPLARPVAMPAGAFPVRSPQTASSAAASSSVRPSRLPAGPRRGSARPTRRARDRVAAPTAGTLLHSAVLRVFPAGQGA